MCDFFGVFTIVAWYVFIVCFRIFVCSFFFVCRWCNVTENVKCLCATTNKNRVFYNPDNPREITSLGEIWIYKAVGMWVLTITAIGIPMIGFWFQNFYDCRVGQIQYDGYCKSCLLASPALLGFFVIYCMGCTFAVIICEIIFFAPFALLFWFNAHENYIDSTKSIVCKKAFDFILDCKSLYTAVDSVTYNNVKSKWSHANREAILKMLETQENFDSLKKAMSDRKIRKVVFSKEERLFRVIYANYCFIVLFEYRGSSKNYASESKLIDFLNEEVIKTQWKNVTLKDIRSRMSVQNRDLFINDLKLPFTIVPQELKERLKRAKNDTATHTDSAFWYYVFILFHGFAVFWGYFMLYIFFPLFLLSRLFSMLFPLMAIIYFNFDIESIQLLQWILTISYTILIISWIISAIRCFDYYHWTSHLIPGGVFWKAVRYNARKNDFIHQYNRLNLMQKYYDIRLNEKFLDSERRNVVIEMLGRDIGGLIVSFWPQFEMKQWLDELTQKHEQLDRLAAKTF